MRGKPAQRVSLQSNNHNSGTRALPIPVLQASEYDIMDRHIVPVEPASGRGETVVIEVQQDGTHELDVRLVGCEGENPFVVNSKGDPNFHDGCMLTRMQSNKASFQN